MLTTGQCQIYPSFEIFMYLDTGFLGSHFFQWTNAAFNSEGFPFRRNNPRMLADVISDCIFKIPIFDPLFETSHSLQFGFHSFCHVERGEYFRLRKYFYKLIGC